MKSTFHKKYSYYPNDLLIDHNIIDYSYLYEKTCLSSKNKKDINEQKLLNFISDKEKFKIKPYYNQKEVFNFLSSKHRAMEKMHLDDDCCFGKIEIRKINIDKNFFPKSEHPKDNKRTISTTKITNKKNHSRKKSKNENNNKVIKEEKLKEFFSSKKLLLSILNEIKEK